MKYDFSDAEVERHFERLKKSLARVFLPVKRGGQRLAEAKEFMLMCEGEDERVWFKHRMTRNYLWLFSDDTLAIPMGDDFFRGFFDIF